MAESADAPDLKSVGSKDREGSSPSSGISPVTTITGTFREDIKIGQILHDQGMQVMGDRIRLAFQVIRECTEQEYRKHHNYDGPFPIDPMGRRTRFYEILPLD